MRLRMCVVLEARRPTEQLRRLGRPPARPLLRWTSCIYYYGAVVGFFLYRFPFFRTTLARRAPVERYIIIFNFFYPLPCDLFLSFPSSPLLPCASVAFIQHCSDLKIASRRHYSDTQPLSLLKPNSSRPSRFSENSREKRTMSDGEGSAQTAAVETGGQSDNMTVAMDGQQQQQQQNVSITKDDGEPNPKKAKLSGGGGGGEVFGRGGGGADKQHSASDKLEHRLGGILCCAVCLDLPRSSIYQCTNGHLMCAGCFAHLLADARLRDEMATCPNCRVDIAKNTATRNLAVEKAVSELPSECQYCAKEFPRNTLQHHEQQLCAERPVKCGYSKIGCPWRGPSHEASEHEKVCPHPSTTGKDVMSALDAMDQKFQEEKLLYDTIFDLMSFEKITFNDLQLKPYRTEEFVHKLYYETARFSAFNFQWVVKTRINNMQRDPALSVDRHMSYQLILKTKIPTPMSVHYLVVKGPFGDMKVNPKIYKFEFNENETETQFVTLPLPDSAECNRLLAAKTINLRLIMFLVSK